MNDRLLLLNNNSGTKGHAWSLGAAQTNNRLRVGNAGLNSYTNTQNYSSNTIISIRGPKPSSEIKSLD